MTNAEVYVSELLNEVLKDRRFRAGVLIVGMAPDPGKGDSRIVSTVQLGEASIGAALDLVFIVQRLRAIADELEAKQKAHGGPVGKA